MFWADEFVRKIGDKKQHVDDMTTPSGYAHIGSLRGPILHDVAYKVLREKNKETIQTYVFNDFDVIDSLPQDLSISHAKYMGYSGRMAPAPYGAKGSFAEYFATDFKKALEDLGVEATYLSSWDMYHEGKFNAVIKEALDNADKIQDIYMRVAGSAKKKSGWLPFQVICPSCSKIGTTKVNGWDGEKVTYTCEKDLVSWAEGCGHEGSMSPYDGSGKLPWKVDWPAHWKVMGVTFEGAGKDHASAGGSYDIAFALCEEVFAYKKPYYFPYEFFLFGGKKMSSSKGIGFKARDITNILPAEVARFLIIRTKPRSAIEFSVDGTTVPDLFDEFDRCAVLFWEKSRDDLARVFEFSQISHWYRKKVYLPRFRDVANVIQLHTVDPKDHFQKEKGEKLTSIERQVLKQRIVHARYWIENHAPEHARFGVTDEIPDAVETLSKAQLNYLKSVSKLLDKQLSPEQMQKELYEKAKEIDVSGKQAFQAIYIALLGKSYGPRAAWFIGALDKDLVQERFRKVADAA